MNGVFFQWIEFFYVIWLIIYFLWGKFSLLSCIIFVKYQLIIFLKEKNQIMYGENGK